MFIVPKVFHQKDAMNPPERLLTLATYEQQVINHLEERKDELVRLCCDLIRIPSWDRETRGEAEVAHRVGKTLNKHAIESDFFTSHPNIENLVASWEGKNSERRLLFNGHADVVPPGEDWTVDPFSGEIKGESIYGRGALDMKGGIAAMTMAMCAISDLEIPLKGTIVLNVVGDEERQGKLGTTWCIDNVWDKIRAEACIVGEPSGIPQIGQAVGIGEKGPVWIRVNTKGHKAHGSVPLLGKNAIVQMFQLLNSLLKQGPPSVPPPISREELINQFKAVLEVDPGTFKTPNNGSAESNLLQASVESLTQTTLNIGTISGGIAANVVPDRCEAQLDFRILPGQAPQEMIDTITKRATALGISDTVHTEIIEACEGTVVPNYQQDQLVNTLYSTSQELTGHTIYFMMPFATDGRLLRAAGLTSTVAYGPGNLLAAHTADESILIDDLVKVSKVYALTALRYLGMNEIN